MAWSPEQYARFRQARKLPFDDLVALVQPQPDMRVLDLGCGSGVLTAELAQRVAARKALGVDSSEEMLAASDEWRSDVVSFRLANLEAFALASDRGAWDLVFSNAALHWVEDHGTLFARLADLMAPGGQLAVQVPANHTHVAHRLADELAAESPWAEALDGFQRGNSVEQPETYDRWLRDLGFEARHVRLQIYPCELPSAAGVVDWLSGSLLTAYQSRLQPETFGRFVNAYRERLLPLLGDEQPFYYPYRRILMWGRRG